MARKREVDGYSVMDGYLSRYDGEPRPETRVAEL
jgi:hypothetical protein